MSIVVIFFTIMLRLIYQSLLFFFHYNAIYQPIILVLFSVAPPWPPIYLLLVKSTEQGTNVTFATRCLHNGIISVPFFVTLLT